MSVINDVLEDVMDMIDAVYASKTPPFPPIVIGAMPADNSLACQISSGSDETTFTDKAMAYQFSMVLNGKHHDQQVVSDTLNDIHQTLTQATTYPAVAGKYQITNIETESTPSYIGREENKQYLYGSALRVRFFYMKGE